MQIAKRTMGWYTKPSAYEAMQVVNTKRRTMAQGHLSDGRGLASSLAAAHNSEVANVSILAQLAVKARLSKKA
ncbi:MAG TPA: hypothetical protein VGM83_20440 [Devosiaceae bacterium]|jgi:hypothetical protein